ncbi:MAG: HAMP domain-containing histidine kinase [Campylobacterales bacterium]|nr:HAMP domain-containing histidine kinase [Campylobacterales bacterium]
MKLSYKQKFIILFICFGTVIVIGTFLSFFYIESANIKKDFIESSKSIMISKQETIKTYFNRIKNTTVALKNTSEKSKLKDFEKITKLLLEENKEIVNISLYSKKQVLLKNVGNKKVQITTINKKASNTLVFSEITYNQYLDAPLITSSIGLKTGETLNITFNLESFFHTIDRSPVGYIHLSDSQGNFLIYQDSYQKRKGLTLEKVYKDTAEDMLYADYYVGTDSFSQTIKLGDDGELKIIFQMKNEKIQEKKQELMRLGLALLVGVLILSFPLAYVFAIIPDKLNRQLEDLNKNLEKKVEEEILIRQEKEKMLVHQSKMASMGEMIGAIAHQWRQPLNTMGLIVMTIRDLFRNDTLSKEEIQDELKRMDYQLEFMSKTIDDFRNFFKSDKEKDDFDVIQSIQEVLTLLSSQIVINNIAIKFSYQENGIEKANIGLSEKDDFNVFASTLGFKNQFKQVILNLVNNSKDIILEKQFDGTIEIIVNKKEHDIVISIEDNGGGVPKAIINKIFEPYFSTKGEKGTGVGLDLAKTIIETNMDGKLFMENSDKGAIFYVVMKNSNKQIEKQNLYLNKESPKSTEIKTLKGNSKEDDESYMNAFYSNLESGDNSVVYDTNDFLKVRSLTPMETKLKVIKKALLNLEENNEKLLKRNPKNVQLLKNKPLLDKLKKSLAEISKDKEGATP